MNVEPKISLIIPTYNAENYLMDAVDSIINQSFGFENIELILVDDNSTDGTKSILNELNNKYENVISIFLEENSGSPSKPRNVGIDNSSTDYIMFLDNDDYYCPEMCETMYSTIKSYDCDIVTCRNYDLYNNKNDFEKFFSILDKKESFIKLKSIDDDSELLSTTSMLIWNKIYKKNLILNNNIKFPVSALYEDVLFNLNAYINANTIVFLNDFYGHVYNIRVEGSDKSTSQDFKKENLLKFKRGLKNIFELLILNDKSYPNLEAEMLIGFTKWLIFTDADINFKLNIFKELHLFYNRYNFFTRLTQISLIFNILINLGIKLFSFSEFTFKIVIKLYNFFKK